MTLHRDTPVVAAGATLGAARVGVIALHGRGAGARDIVEFAASELASERVALAAPEARHATWYPRSFLAPLAENEPWLGSALERVGGLVSEMERAGLPSDRIVLFGFSQGACLACEFVARHPRRWGGLIAATGGRIGPFGTHFEARGDLAGTPVHLSAGDPDPHVPWSRVEETAANLRAMGAAVVLRRAPGFPHAVHPDAIAFTRALLTRLA